MPPISLSDDQLLTIQQHAEPLHPDDRGLYLERVAELLRGQTIGDGAVARAARQAQGELLKPPDLAGGVPKPLRRFAQRASSVT